MLLTGAMHEGIAYLALCPSVNHKIQDGKCCCCFCCFGDLPVSVTAKICAIGSNVFNLLTFLTPGAFRSVIKVKLLREAQSLKSGLEDVCMVCD